MPQAKMYALHSSPLFCLASKRRLCAHLYTNLSEIRSLQKSRNYRIWTQTSKNKNKRRRIIEPKPTLKRIQKRLQVLLSRIDKPTYLYSGVKGISHIDNAVRHLGQDYVLNLDIEKFYDNCRRNSVFRLFHYTFEMPEDLAWILADITTFEDALPAGSPCSQLVAFFAYKDTFDAINDLADQHGLGFSLFVDDMTFSSPNPIPEVIPRLVQKELKRVGHSINDKKTKRFRRADFKVVTGVALSPTGDLKVKNSQRRAIIGNFGALRRLIEKNPKLIRSLTGRIQAARQIEPQIFPGICDEVFKTKSEQNEGPR
jgi:RNA-directed DNA polymerase